MKPLIKDISYFTMGLFYTYVGVDHFINPAWYEQIVPPFLPFQHGLVLISGCFEIIFGISLFFSSSRVIAAWGIIFLLIAVYPANIYLAYTNGEALGVTPLVAWFRLPIQFIFIAIAFWHTKR